jgi:microcystin-dependent protein
MTNCSNCYNGCTEIVSDRCVKYTGIDVPVLGIQTGDSLSFVEQALITFLTSTLDGTGVKIDLAPTVVCNLVNQYLPTCKDLSIVDISKALIEAACDLQAQVDAIDADLAILNGDYTIGCLTGVTASSDTHAIVQAVINKLCQLEVDLVALSLDLVTNYVSVADIDTYIQAYLNSIPGTTLVNTKMVPYTAVPFFPTPTFLTGKFDGTGAGIGDWQKIYLCNGNNNTPDLRGRTLVGATNGMGGGAFNPFVDPNIIGSGNPNYSLNTEVGANQITLGATQIPSHSHSSVVSSAGLHTHYTVVAGSLTADNANSLFDGSNVSRNDLGLTSIAYNQNSNAYDYELTSSPGTINAGKTSEDGLHTHSVTIGDTGGNLPHPNIQPSVGSYYIMYIP